MNYPHKYFEDEVREGFYITGEMKRVWAAQIEVLSEIDKLCKKHNIKWFADCGTLLGTVRHKGYIPWDDDLDICMLRDDYIKFREIAKKELTEGFLCLSLWDDDPFYQYLLRVTNGKKFNYDVDFLDKFYDCQYPIGVDIFPLDYVSPDSEKEESRKEIALQLMACGDALSENKIDDKDKPELIKLVREVEKLCGVRIDSYRPLKQRIFMAAEILFTLFSSREATEVVLMPYWLQYNNHKYSMELFRETIMMPFEHIEVPVPVEYDRVLNIEYGDYMRLSKGGGVHGYPFFEELEKLLIEKIDRYYFRYKFSAEDLDNTDRQTGDYTKKQTINYLNMTKEAHSAIVLMTMQGNIETSCNLLAACQESAVNIGELLEKTYGDGFEAVHILEEYCESVYQLYQALINGEFNQSDADGISVFLDEIYGRMTDILNSYVISRKEMVFIPYRADYWKSMEPMWRKAVCEGTYDVYVVPIPYYKKTARSELADMYYEADELPDYVELTDYKSYDFVRRHPDVIVTMNPFDECNYTISLSREHFSKNLKKYTEELIYISPYIMDEIGLDKETKAWKTLDYFCAVPGVVHADRVIVQSDSMRQTYIERLTDMSGEEYRNVWTEKVGTYELFLQGVGSEPASSEINSENDDSKAEYKKNLTGKLSSEWKNIIFKSDGGLKKILLYNVSIASIVQYGDKTLIKIEDTLEKFKAAKDDIAVVWYCNPHLIKTLKGVDLKLRDRFRSIVERYKSEGWGIYDESYDYSSLIELCDAYYGDSGNIPHVLRYDKKPVMLQNVDIVG